MGSYYMEMIGGGILSIMIIKEVFAFIIKQKLNGKNGKNNIHNMEMSIVEVKKDLSQMQTQRTEDALVKISEAIQKQTEILEHMSLDIKDLKMDVHK